MPRIPAKVQVSAPTLTIEDVGKGQDIPQKVHSSASAHTIQDVEKGKDNPEKLTRYIVPKIVYDDTYDIEEPEEIENTAEPDVIEEDKDKYQHYFFDQIKFKRQQWRMSWFTVVSMAAFAIDLSAISNFHTYMAAHGGLIFLVPYTVMMAILVVPLIYLEGLMGQYFQVTFIGIWGICPLVKFLVLASYWCSVLFAVFNTAFTMYGVIMLIQSCKSTLQSKNNAFRQCDNEWNSCRCDGIVPEKDCTLDDIPELEMRVPAEFEYFIGEVLRLTKTKLHDPGIIKEIRDNGNLSTSFGFANAEEGVGAMVGTSCVIISITFLVILAMLLSSDRTIGLFYSFTTLYPIMALSLLVCRGFTLEGCIDGLVKYMKPDFLKLLNFKAWTAAASNAFYRMGTGYGFYVSINSFNPLHENLLKCILGFLTLDTVTILLCCLAEYTLLGHHYFLLDEDLPDSYIGRDNSTDSASLYPFVEFPKLISTVPGAGFFSIVYYLMVVCMTVDTCIAILHSVCYGLYEEYRRKYPTQKVKFLVFAVSIITILYLVALSSATRVSWEYWGGAWVATYVGKYMVVPGILLISPVQIIAIVYIWGMENLCQAVETITGSRPSVYWRFCWKYTCPLFVSFFLAVYLKTSSLYNKMELFGLVAPEGTVTFAAIIRHFGLSLFGVYILLLLYRTSKKASGKQLLAIIISPVYEENEIIEDVRNAKRLHCKHYCYLLSPEEKRERMECIQSFCRKILGRQNRVNYTDFSNEGQYRKEEEQENQNHDQQPKDATSEITVRH